MASQLPTERLLSRDRDSASACSRLLNGFNMHKGPATRLRRYYLWNWNSFLYVDYMSSGSSRNIADAIADGIIGARADAKAGG